MRTPDRPRLAYLATIPLLLAACAGEPALRGKVERLEGEAAAAVAAPAPERLSLDAIVALGRSGATPEQIVERLRATATRHALSASQVVELRLLGVDLRVLDHLVDSERRAVWDDVAAQLAQREQACSDRLKHERQQCQAQLSHHPLWPNFPLNCWPPRPGYPYWRCF